MNTCYHMYRRLLHWIIEQSTTNYNNQHGGMDYILYKHQQQYCRQVMTGKRKNNEKMVSMRTAQWTSCTNFSCFTYFFFVLFFLYQSTKSRSMKPQLKVYIHYKAYIHYWTCNVIMAWQGFKLCETISVLYFIHTLRRKQMWS